MPRTTTLINLLAILEQNKGSDWDEFIEAMEVTKDNGGKTGLAGEAGVSLRALA